MLIVDPLFGDRNLCQPGETLLACEYRLIRPSVAFIMFGESDVHALTAAQYEQAMRQVIQTSIDRGVIPVVTTFPSDPADNSKWMDVLEFNAILVRLAGEYDVPLLNFWRAARDLPHNGIEDDLLHISYSGDEWVRFTGDENQWGFTRWNLIALQTLDNLRRAVLSR